ncbi:MAG TPA: SPOR domain-containing protein [Methylomirabilota bacterium]|nr:SPOR domain-containing protein [Methylomirabilota bacterium]
MKYRHVWPGVLLLGALIVLLVSLLTWGDRFLSPGPEGGIRHLLPFWAASRPPQEQPEPPRRLALAPPAEPSQAPATASVERAPATPPDATAEASREQEPPPAPADAPARPPAQPQPQARYALDLGTFAIPEDAERVEAQLNRAGFSTVRFRQQAEARLFSVFVEPLRSAEEAQAAVERLRQEGFSQAVALVRGNGLAVRVLQAVPLRTAVGAAERLKAAGHEARVTAERTRAGYITLRLGNFASRAEAEAASAQIVALGVPNEVVQIK